MEHEIADLLSGMRKNESGAYRCKDYMVTKECSDCDGIDESWRQRMCEWMYGVVDHCNFRRDIVAVATVYLDLCLSKDTTIINSRRTYQLAAMTSLYLAMKIYDTSYVKLESLIKLGRGLFCETDVIQMESRLLHKLEWRAHPPTAMCFLRHFIRLIPSSVSSSTTYMLSEVSRFIVEISVCLYKFVKFLPSQIAFASLFIAIEGIDTSCYPDWQREQTFFRLSTYARMSRYGFSTQEVIRRLKASFEKNVDLSSLMSTIDPNCRAARRSPPNTGAIHNKHHVVPDCDDSPTGVDRQGIDRQMAH